MKPEPRPEPVRPSTPMPTTDGIARSTTETTVCSYSVSAEPRTGLALAPRPALVTLASGPAGGALATGGVVPVVAAGGALAVAGATVGAAAAGAATVGWGARGRAKPMSPVQPTIALPARATARRHPRIKCRDM